MQAVFLQYLNDITCAPFSTFFVRLQQQFPESAGMSVTADPVGIQVLPTLNGAGLGTTSTVARSGTTLTVAGSGTTSTVADSGTTLTVAGSSELSTASSS